MWFTPFWWIRATRRTTVALEKLSTGRRASEALKRLPGSGELSSLAGSLPATSPQRSVFCGRGGSMSPPAFRPGRGVKKGEKTEPLARGGGLGGRDAKLQLSSSTTHTVKLATPTS